LIIGGGNLAGEVCKNLVLMGTNVTLYDPFQVTKQDLEVNPFISQDFLGANVK
jgi:Trk K+ transport system NAD-binding subunit